MAGSNIKKKSFAEFYVDVGRFNNFSNFNFSLEPAVVAELYQAFIFKFE